MKIEIWTDVICPWCYLGKRRLEQAVRAHDGDVTLVYRAYQLDPSPVPEPIPVLDALAAKFGGPEQARQMTGRVREIAAGDGLTLNFDRAVAANTFDAHRLIRWAADLGAQAEMVESVHRAHFVDGVDLGSRDALAALAGPLGLDGSAARAWLDSDSGVKEVQDDLDTAHELGVSSVPTFVLAERYAVVGAQDVITLRAALAEAARRQADDVRR
jgi:predicted DsbA family dithiol-disulfide isomerase